jgi:hypothetical protein
MPERQKVFTPGKISQERCLIRRVSPAPRPSRRRRPVRRDRVARAEKRRLLHAAVCRVRPLLLQSEGAIAAVVRRRPGASSVNVSVWHLSSASWPELSYQPSRCGSVISRTSWRIQRSVAIGSLQPTGRPLLHSGYGTTRSARTLPYVSGSPRNCSCIR